MTKNKNNLYKYDIIITSLHLIQKFERDFIHEYFHQNMRVLVFII